MSVQLGLGLISIARPWGFVKAAVPSDTELSHLLGEALRLGIRFFDTAPSYGASEERFGRFLGTLRPPMIQELTIATKFGEHWDAASDRLSVDHSYDALSRSFEQSLQRLGKIDILQVHKAEPWVLRDAGVRRALNRARSAGVREFGASVKDIETAEVALQEDLYSYVQFPFNLNSSGMEAAFEMASATGKRVLVNRPFGMGELLYSNGALLRGPDRIQAAYEAILKKTFSGVILIGTRSAEHLRLNISVFHDTAGVGAGQEPSRAL